MQKIEITYFQMILMGIGVGLILGLIPLVLGIIKGNKKLGFWGFICSIAGGAIWSLVSLIVAIIFSVLILMKPSGKKPVEGADQNSAEKPVKDSENL